MPSTLRKLIDSAKSIKVTASFCKIPNTHINNFESYYENKIRVDGKECDRLRELKKFHDENPLSPHIENIQSWTYPWDFDHVFVNMTVTKSGKVKVILSQPFHELYNKYQAKAIQPPVEERVRLMKQARYSEHTLIDIVKKDEKNKKNVQKNQKFLEIIFGRK